MNPELLKYFTSPTAAAEFSLLHTDGETRQKLLGVRVYHYRDRDLANQWLSKLKSLNMPNYANTEAIAMHAEMTAR